MRLLLKRFAEFGDEGTASWIRVTRWRFCGLELPWRGEEGGNGERCISRVPAGLYKLVYDRDKWLYYLVGKGVVRYEEQATNGERWGIRLEVANLASQLQGCIAVGSSLGFLGDEFALLGSKHAHDQLMELLSWEKGQNEILIQDKFGGWAHA